MKKQSYYQHQVDLRKRRVATKQRLANIPVTQAEASVRLR